MFELIIFTFENLGPSIILRSIFYLKKIVCCLFAYLLVSLFVCFVVVVFIVVVCFFCSVGL